MSFCERAGLGIVLGALALCAVGCGSAPPAPQAAAVPPPPTSSAVPASPSDPPGETGETAGQQCRLSDLTAERADGPYEAGTNHVLVVWTNRSDRTCTMSGFGGVDLVDAQGRRLSAARTSETAGVVSLAPRGQAHSTLSYPSAGGTGVFAPREVLATPPNETQSARFAWGTGGIPEYEAPGDSDQVRISPVAPNAS